MHDSETNQQKGHWNYEKHPVDGEVGSRVENIIAEHTNERDFQHDEGRASRVLDFEGSRRGQLRRSWTVDKAV